MSSILIIAYLLIHYIESCSIARPPSGKYYISNVELLDAERYPDSVLVQFRTTGLSSVTSNYIGPWCKIMNTTDGSVEYTVPCSDYSNLTRSWTLPNTQSTSTPISCKDNCDGISATCTINRNSITYTIPDIPYKNSVQGCAAISIPGTLATSFTMNDLSTTYIIFSSNTVGVEFDSSSASGYNLISVDREGTGWDYIVPNSPWMMFGGLTEAPSIYPGVNVIRHGLPCCICHSWELYTYNIESDPSGIYDQIITLNSLTYGGYVDNVKRRVIDWGLYYSDTITIYDLQTGNKQAFTPNLCDVTVNCFASPCQFASCPFSTNARCVDDFCGGCNARWFCGSREITNQCQDTPNQFVETCRTV